MLVLFEKGLQDSIDDAFCDKKKKSKEEGCS